MNPIVIENFDSIPERSEIDQNLFTICQNQSNLILIDICGLILELDFESD